MSNRLYYYTIYMLLASLLAGCQDGVDLPVQHADGYSQICIGVGGTQAAVTRASTDYRAWDAVVDPATMGIYAYHSMPSQRVAFYNDEQFVPPTPEQQSAAGTNGATKWSPANSEHVKEWIGAELYDKSGFAFFGYMPYPDAASNKVTAVSLDWNEPATTFTLSLSYEIPQVFMTQTTLMPLLCHEPGVKPDLKYGETIDKTVQMRFDQTLTGYELRFKLGEKMDQVRDITITGVRIFSAKDDSGEPLVLPYRGVVSRSYTYEPNDTWSIGDIEWAITEQDYKALTDQPADAAYVLAHTSADGLVLNHTDYQRWGSTFYCIPAPTAADFRPVIEVTYDVKTNTTEGSEVTRRGVVSTIALTTENFRNYTGGKPDVITQLQILIVPNYLYVLADADQQAGVVVIPAP